MVQQFKANSGLPPLPKAKDLLNITAAAVLMLSGTAALAPSYYIELYLDLDSTGLSDSFLILIYFTPMTLVVCFMAPLLMMHVNKDFSDFVKERLAKWSLFRKW